MRSMTYRVATGLVIMMLFFAATIPVSAQGRNRWEANRCYCASPLGAMGRLGGAIVYTTASIAATGIRMIGRSMYPYPYSYGYGYSAPIYSTPIYSPPVYTSPFYNQPVVVAPVATAYSVNPAAVVVPAAGYRPAYGFGVNLFKR